MPREVAAPMCTAAHIAVPPGQAETKPACLWPVRQKPSVLTVWCDTLFAKGQTVKHKRPNNHCIVMPFP
eukprot:13676161-Heterocapsa_arctica.AAC.2